MVKLASEAILRAARLALAMRRPYITEALMALHPVPVRGIMTMAVDKHGRLYYDPDTIQRTNIDIITGMLYHELCHLLRAHHVRLDGLPKDIANIASDIEINDDIREEHDLTLPDIALYPEAFNLPAKRTAEEYAEMLLRNSEENKDNGGKDTGKNKKGKNNRDGAGGGQANKRRSGDARGSKDGEAGGDASDSDPRASSSSPRTSSKPAPSSKSPSSSAGSGEQESREQEDDACGSTPHASPSHGNHGDGKEPDTPAPTAGRCGSCATGVPEPWELGPPEESGVPGLSPQEVEVIRREVARRILEGTLGRGNIPGYWRRWAEGVLTPPKVNWRRELAACVRNALTHAMGAVDYTFKRPSRRQAAYGEVIMPSLQQPTLSVAVVIDTSGSISDEMLYRAYCETVGILRTSGVYSCHVLAVDCVVQSCKRVLTPSQIKDLLVGGGGTDMGRGIEAAMKLHPRPNVVVVITDGETPWPSEAPSGARVIVALTRKGKKAPNWAHVVYIEEG